MLTKKQNSRSKNADTFSRKDFQWELNLLSNEVRFILAVPLFHLDADMIVISVFFGVWVEFFIGLNLFLTDLKNEKCLKN